MFELVPYILALDSEEDHLDEFKSKIQFISAQDDQPKNKIS